MIKSGFAITSSFIFFIPTHMKKIVFGILMLMTLTIGVGSSLAQNEQIPPPTTDVVTATDVVSTDAGLTPESPFYFLDRLGEFFRNLFTFSPEAKVKLKIEFAKERVAEIKIMLEDEDTNTDDVDEAQTLLVEDIQDAQDIVNEEKIEDDEISAFTTSLDNEIETDDEDNKQAFEEVKNQLKDHQEAMDSEDEATIEAPENREDNTKFEDREGGEQETKVEKWENREDAENVERQNEREDD